MRATAAAALVFAVGCFNPRLAPNVACSPDGTCPTGQQCDRGQVPPVCVTALADAGPGDTGADVASDATALSVEILGMNVTASSGLTTTLTLSRDVPAGALVIVQVGGRGVAPIAIADSRGNSWSKAVELSNSTNASAAGIYYTALSAPMKASDTITATLGGAANTNDRAIGALYATGLASLDQTGSAQTLCSAPTTDTSGAVTASAELVVGVTSTGHSVADTFTPSSDFTQLYGYASALSSGSLDYKLADALSGVQTYGTTTPAPGSSNCAVAIATFK
jgi:hypothetical protein